MKLPVETSSSVVNIPKCQDVVPMDTDDVVMDTPEDGKIEANGSPILNFIGAVWFPAPIYHISCMYS